MPTQGTTRFPRVWTAGWHDLVSVVRPDQLPGVSAILRSAARSLLQQGDAVPGSALPGRYQGTGYLDATGIGEELHPVAAPSGSATVPFAAELWGDDQGEGTTTLRLVDRYGHSPARALSWGPWR